MEDLGFIITCYVASFGAVALLAWRIVRQGRILSAQVPDEDKPWT